MSDEDKERDNTIKFSDHARSHFAATDDDKAREIFEREMGRRFERLALDDSGSGDPASLEMAWAKVHQLVRYHCEAWSLDAGPLIEKLRQINPSAGLFDTRSLPAPEVDRVRRLRDRAVRSAEKAHRRWVHVRADAGPQRAGGQPAAQKNVMVFVALALEVLDRFAPDREGGSPDGCPKVTVERIGSHWLTDEREGSDE